MLPAVLPEISFVVSQIDERRFQRIRNAITNLGYTIQQNQGAAMLPKTLMGFCILFFPSFNVKSALTRLVIEIFRSSFQSNIQRDATYFMHNKRSKRTDVKQFLIWTTGFGTEKNQCMFATNQFVNNFKTHKPGDHEKDNHLN
jgi:hypothetical protein